MLNLPPFYVEEQICSELLLNSRPWSPSGSSFVLTGEDRNVERAVNLQLCSQSSTQMSVNHPLCSPPTRETHPSLEWTSTPAEGDVKAASSCLTAPIYGV